MRELCFECGDAFAGCGLRVRGTFASVLRFGLCLLEFGLSGSEVGLELADLLVRGVTGCRAGVTRAVEFGLELLSAVVVLRGLRGGDVDERLELGGGARGFFRVLREPRL